MALRINLHHEIDKARIAQKRDPLKLSMMGLAVLVALFALYYVFELAKMGAINRELARKKTAFEAIDPQAKAAKKREEELTNTLKKSDLLVKRIEGRFYWAPVLEQLNKVVPREVQITKLSGEVQGETVKRASFTLDGLSAGSDPRKVAEDLRTAIAEEFGKRYTKVSSTFRSLEDGVEVVRLDGNQWPTATFAITVQLTIGEEAAPATPVRRQKK